MTTKVLGKLHFFINKKIYKTVGYLFSSTDATSTKILPEIIRSEIKKRLIKS